MDKVKTVEELAVLVEGLKKQGKTVALCHGVFDLMHPGHIKHFQSAKSKADILVVTVTPDRFVNKGPGRPVFTEQLRAETVASLDCVAYAAINNWPTAVEMLKLVKPSFYVKGPDYSDASKDITGGINQERKAVESVGGKIVFTDDITFSSTELLNKFFGVFPEETRAFLEKFKQKYTADDIIERLKALKDMKVLVIGDTIIDEYHYCRGLGKSAKDNFITAQHISEEKFAGGVLACANHIAGFCGQVDLLTVLGSGNTQEEYIRGRLKKNVNPVFFYRDGAPTVVKRRFVDHVFMSKIFEIAFFEDTVLPEELINSVSGHIDKVVGGYDLVLVSDFGHGFINRQIIQSLEQARFLAVNAQTNSANNGYNLITKYDTAHYICIDEPEIRLAAHNKYGDIQKIIKNIAVKLNSDKISVTRGHLGALTYDKTLDAFFEAPAVSGKLVDRVGAGDSYLSVTSPLVASGAEMDLVGFVGNAVAAIKVGIVCNRESVEPVELFKFIKTLLK